MGTIELGASSAIPNTTPNVPLYQNSYKYFPDGPVALLADPGGTQMYWAGSSSYRTAGATFSGGTITSTGSAPGAAVISAGVFGEASYSYDNGGAWIYSVHRRNGNNLLGFYHAEDHWPGQTNPNKIAWKSMAVATSTNNGQSWSKGGQFLTKAGVQPATPTWGGDGDGSVIYDSVHQRWVCFYADNWLKMAVSYDAAAAPGTWQKYYQNTTSLLQGQGTQPGIGGLDDPIPSLSNWSGGDATVTWNTYLNRYVMMFHTWDYGSTNPNYAYRNSIMLATSTDLFNWSTPVKLLGNPSAGQRYWYPTLLGAAADGTTGQTATLAYAYFPNIAADATNRYANQMSITFSVPEPGAIPAFLCLGVIAMSRGRRGAEHKRQRPT